MKEKYSIVIRGDITRRKKSRIKNITEYILVSRKDQSANNILFTYIVVLVFYFYFSWFKKQNSLTWNNALKLENKQFI